MKTKSTKYIFKLINILLPLIIAVFMDILRIIKSKAETQIWSKVSNNTKLYNV